MPVRRILSVLGCNAIPALLAAAALQGRPAQAADLTVIVTNVKAAAGMVRVAVFNDPGDFPRPDRILAGKVVAATPGSVTVTFTDLPPGDYAVSAYHDLDGNGQLDRNFFGVPSEPYGFSRDARGLGGPPGFGDAKVTVPAAGMRIRFAVQ